MQTLHERSISHRRRAEEMEALASEAHEGERREHYLELARQWARQAEACEAAERRRAAV
jgi:hypothetical protein